MGQVTSRISDELEAEYTRWAAEQKVQRSDLIRQVLIEGAQARREGRTLFARPQALGPADVTRVLTRVDQQTTEMDRVFRQVAKHDARLARMTSEDTRMVSEARQAIVADMTERVSKAVEIIVREQSRSRDAVLAAGTELPATLVGMIAALPVFTETSAALARIEEFARQPRMNRVLVLGDDRMLSLAFLMLAGSAVFTLGALMALCLTVISHSFGMMVVDRVIPSDQGICELIRYRDGVSDCRVPGLPDRPSASGIDPTVAPEPEPKPRHHHQYNP